MTDLFNKILQQFTQVLTISSVQQKPQTLKLYNQLSRAVNQCKKLFPTIHPAKNPDEVNAAKKLAEICTVLYWGIAQDRSDIRDEVLLLFSDLEYPIDFESFVYDTNFRDMYQPIILQYHHDPSCNISISPKEEQSSLGEQKQIISIQEYPRL